MFLFKEQNNGFFLFLFFSKVTVSKLEKNWKIRREDERSIGELWQIVGRRVKQVEESSVGELEEEEERKSDGE